MNFNTGFTEDQAERKFYGAYYTPEPIADAITRWAIRSPSDRVLEPSFGDGVFIAAALRQLDALGAIGGQPQVIGTDIDLEALSRVCATSRGVADLRGSDFLALEPSGTWANLTAAIGNPPYVRHHSIEKGTIADLRRQELDLGRGVDIWCTFVAHSMRFLAPGGRLAFILPGSFRFARYAVEIRNRLVNAFETTVAIRLAFNAFRGSGADERGIVVLCSGFQKGPSAGWIEQIAWDAEDLGRRLEALSQGAECSDAPKPFIAKRGIRTRPLGDLAQVRIGFVTGANKFFIVNDSTRQFFDLPAASLRPVLARTAQASGIIFDGEDHAQAAARDERVWLFAPAGLGEKNGSVRQYLATLKRSVRRGTTWFGKRPRWYEPEVGPQPDAVLTYMNHLGPRIVMLQGAVGATNTFHTLTFNKTKGDPDPAIIILSMLTSYAQLSAETVGRSYGGGVLKLELGEARRVELPIPAVEPDNFDQAIALADQALKSGDADAACAIADDLILRPMLGRNYMDIRSDLLAELAAVRSLRLSGSRKGQGAR